MIHESLKRIEDSNRTERSRGILEPQRGGKPGREQIPPKRELEPGGNRQIACGPYGPRGFESHPRRHRINCNLDMLERKDKILT